MYFLIAIAIVAPEPQAFMAHTPDLKTCLALKADQEKQLKSMRVPYVLECVQATVPGKQL